MFSLRPILHLSLFLVSFFVMLSEAWAVEQPYLFRISKGARVSWILGTYHMGIDLQEVEPYIHGPIKSSRVLFFEWLAPAERIALFHTNPAEAILTSKAYDLTLGRSLAEETKQILGERFGIPGPLLERLTTASCEQVEDFQVYKSKAPMMDYQLLTRVREMGKNIRALDTGDLLSRADAADRASDQRRGIPECNLDENVKKIWFASLTNFDARVEIYRQGQKKFGEDYSEDNGVALRNLEWMGALLPELEKGQVFIDVGVGHLYGRFGLINLLSQAGFKVERVSRQLVIKKRH